MENNDFIHKKTGKTYQVIGVKIKNATNGHEGKNMVLYQDAAGQQFVREEKEFAQKFRPSDETIDKAILQAEISIFDPRECRECGCTDERACPGGCYWVEDDLCSACAEKLQEVS
jgi:hypothetical protein